jgi:tRNA modification GTPase
MEHTIYALASGRGRAGVAVIRLSGPHAHAAIVALTGGLPEVRRASLRNLRWEGEVLDTALVIVFAKGASFTGEESAEIHLHGGQAVVAVVLQALASIDGLRIAEAGEFTRRALENGCLDLHEVEGLADLIDAETEGQRKQAQRLLQGDFAERVATWRDGLLHALALVEATIDFADEDVPVDVWPEVRHQVAVLAGQMQADLEGAQAAERMRSGFEVVILGPPNVGKSTLINALSGRDAAMTSDIAGTTRDVIEVRLDLDGLPAILLDTAGLRETADILEREGIRRARERAHGADMIVLVRDAAHADWSDVVLMPDLVVSSKADLGYAERDDLAVSAVTGVGMRALRDKIVSHLARKVTMSGVVLNARHKEAVARATAALHQAEVAIDVGGDTEIVALHLHEARHAVASLTGAIGTEDVLGEIFSRFCIGK